MADELRLGHAERGGHPAEEGDVGADVEVDEASDGGAAAGGVVVLALVREVELGEVDAVVDGLDAEHGEEEQEDEGAQDVDEGRHAQVLQRRHCCCCCLLSLLASGTGGRMKGRKAGRGLAMEEETDRSVARKERRGRC